MKNRNNKVQEHEIVSTMRRWPGYTVAVAATALAALVRLALEQLVGTLPHFIMFYPAVFAAAVVGGTGPGVLATLLSILIGDLLFIEPVGKLGGAVTTADAVAMGLFIAINLAISILGGRFRLKSQALRENETRLRLAHQAAHIGAFEWNVQTGIITWTPELEAMYGLSAGEFGRTESAWEQLVHPDDRAKAVGIVQRALKTFQPEEGDWRVVWPDGSVHWLAGRCQAFKDRAGKPVRLVGANVNITDREKTREALRQSEERFRTMANAIPQLAWIGRADGYVFWYNQRWYEYTGTTLEQMEGFGWQSVQDPQVLPEIVEQRQRSIVTGQPFEMEFPMRGADGRFRPFLTRIMPLKDNEGRVALWFGTATDITERKQLQDHLEELVDERTAKLREAMAELEHMSYSMVHDMRAPLRAMQSFAGMMQEECGDCRRSPGLDYLGRIRESSNRLDRLITDALNYNEVVRENLPTTSVELGRLLRGMLQSYPNLHPPAADITLEFKELFVLGNESLLTQCFGNLLGNAVKFVASGVKPRVRVWAKSSTLNARPATIISVEDNGIGIPKDAQERMFRMFQRMHHESEYPGTGIGLTIVKKAVERMGGHICLESEPGKGSRFYVELPRPVDAQTRQRLQEAA